MTSSTRSGANWRSIGRMLARKPGWNRDVILVDLRNHGASPHAPSMSLQEHSADLINFIKSRGLKSVALMVCNTNHTTYDSHVGVITEAYYM